MSENNKKRVAILLHGLGANGIDTLFANLSNEWDLNKFDITYLLALDKGVKTFWGEKVKESGVKIIHITDLDGSKLLYWPKNLYKTLKKTGPYDVIHVNMDMFNGFNLLIAWLAGVKKRVCHSHLATNRFDINFPKRVIKHVYLWGMRVLMALFSTDKIACSEEAGRHFYGRHRFRVLFNGIDLQKFMFSEAREGGTFVTVGRITYHKNPLFTVEVFAKILKRHPSSKMIWVGSGDMEQATKDKARQLGIDGNIQFLGARSDVHEILKKCDYFLFPSVSEGFGLVLIEAQAAGLDCFASETVPRLTDCGKCQYISLEEPPAVWATKICDYIDGEDRMTIDRDRLGQFGIHRMAKELEKIYSANG